MKLLNTKDKVKKLLEGMLWLRDDDNALMIEIWQEELGYNWDHFASKFINHLLTSPESIRRCRQKLQEENPSLRGTNYGKRHKAQEKVKEELRADGWDRIEVGKNYIEWSDKLKPANGHELKGQTKLDL